MKSGKAIVEGSEGQSDGSKRKLLLTRDEDLGIEMDCEDAEVGATSSGLHDCCMVIPC